MMNIMLQTFKGKVIRRKIGKGSKSEKEANIILTECGKEFVLRQQGGNALQDPILDALVGKTIKVAGLIHSYVLIIHSFEEAEDNSKENTAGA